MDRITFWFILPAYSFEMSVSGVDMHKFGGKSPGTLWTVYHFLVSVEKYPGSLPPCKHSLWKVTLVKVLIIRLLGGQ